MYAYQREKMKEEKRKQLEGRRERLRQLLLEEQELLARELEALRLSMDLREGRIRERHGSLKSAREEQRKLVTSSPLGATEQECPQLVSDMWDHGWALWADQTAVNCKASRGRYLCCIVRDVCFAQATSVLFGPLNHYVRVLCLHSSPVVPQRLGTGVFYLPSSCGEW